jgi:hypothetical protein
MPGDGTLFRLILTELLAYNCGRSENMNVLTDKKPIDEALMEKVIQKLKIREQNPTDAQIGHAYRLEQAQQLIDMAKAYAAGKKVEKTGK